MRIVTPPLIAVLTFVAVVHAQVCVLEFPMNEGQAAGTEDFSGYGKEGLLIDPGQPGTIGWGGGRTVAAEDYAVMFDDDRDYIQVNHSSSITPTGAFRCSVWFKPVGEVVIYGPREGFTRTYSLFSKGFNNGGTNEGIGMYIADNAILHGIICFENAGMKDLISSGSMDGTVLHSQWNHAALWFDGVDTYGMELNGIHLNLDGGGTLPAVDSVRFSARDMFIGFDEWNGSFFNGVIDDVNLILDGADKVLDLTFSDGSGTVVTDLSGYANSGTLVDQNTGGTIYWVFGRTIPEDINDYGIVMYDDYIFVEDSEELNFTGSFEASIWFKPKGSGRYYDAGGQQIEGFASDLGVFNKGHNNGGTDEGYGMYVGSNAVLHGLIAFENAGLKDFYDSSVNGRVVAGQWNHGKMTFDGDRTYALYLNDMKVFEQMLPSSDKIKPCGESMQIGHDRWTNGYMDGSVDDMIIIDNDRLCRPGSIPGDISGPDGEPDCSVNIYDFAEFAVQWLKCNLAIRENCN